MSWTTTLARAATAGRVRRPLIDTRKFSPATARTLRSGGRSTLDPSSGRSCSAVTSAFPLVRSPAHPRSRSLAPVHTHPFFRTLSVDGPVSLSSFLRARRFAEETQELRGRAMLSTFPFVPLVPRTVSSRRNARDLSHPSRKPVTTEGRPPSRRNVPGRATA